MKITDKNIAKLMDVLDEHLYKYPELLKNTELLVKHHLASTPEVATLFQKTYAKNPDAGLITLIYGHYHPIYIQTGHLCQRIPTGDLEKSVNFILGVISTFNEHHNHYYVESTKTNSAVK